MDPAHQEIIYGDLLDEIFADEGWSNAFSPQSHFHVYNSTH
jgi:hypothetical protein